MPIPLIATKFALPPVRLQDVVRQRLLDQLNIGVTRKLTLLAAPAGFGKSTLLSTWAAQVRQPVAWLALDAGDNDINGFLLYLVSALRQFAPTVAEWACTALQSPQPPSAEAVLTAILNELATTDQRCILILDDYHMIDLPAIDQALTFVLLHQPAQLHLFIATRRNPRIPLGRLRAQGQLHELRTHDLRFTSAETALFLQHAMGVRLSAEATEALELRTEGWVVGLQLAALALHHQPDVMRFIQSFRGSHQYVLDYLVEEALAQQPLPIQQFLLHTAILDRLCGSLCDAVLNEPTINGAAMLYEIEQANLFLIVLDHERHWYRYHHLFADALRQRLQQHAAARDIALLHQRASTWYELHGYELEAFHHAAAAQDVDRAERLIAGKGMPLHYRGALTNVLAWLERLPHLVFDTRPSLWVLYASVATMSGQARSEVEQKLQAAEALMKQAMMDSQQRDLIGQIAAIRAMLAIPLNDIDTIEAQSRRALEYLGTEQLPVRTTATWTLGLAHQFRGAYAAASSAYIEAIAISQTTGNLMITIAATTCLGQVQEAENQLNAAAASFRQVLAIAGEPPLPAACEAYLGLARIAVRWNHLEQAERYLEQSTHLARQIKTTDTAAACALLLARIKQLQGDLPAAKAALVHAEQLIQYYQFRHRIPELTELQAALQSPQPKLPIVAHETELLSQRELEILQLIAQGLSNQAICERLFLALDTVKGHNRRIFDKLEVQRRTEAVARARTLGILTGL